MLNGIGDAIFYFMPVILGYTAAKKFRYVLTVGIVIGAALCYPTIQGSALQTAFETTAGAEPQRRIIYSAYLPMIHLLGFLGSVRTIQKCRTNHLHYCFSPHSSKKVFKRIIPEVVQTFLVPFFVLLIALPIGFLVIGPIVSMLTDLLSAGFTTALMSFSPALMV